jgi:hypothetical protein
MERLKKAIEAAKMEISGSELKGADLRVRQPNMIVVLKAYPSPDFEPRNLPKEQKVKVNTLADALKKVNDYISKNDLGGSNWGPDAGAVFLDGKKFAWISYNGRVWEVG